MTMTGMKLAAGIAMVSGGAAPVLAQVDPGDLEGLSPAALATVIALAALGVLVFMVRSLLPVLRDLIKEMDVTNTRMQELCARLNVRPCLLDGKVSEAQREANEIIAEAKAEAKRIHEKK